MSLIGYGVDNIFKLSLGFAYRPFSLYFFSFFFKVDHIVKPMKASLSNVSRVVKNKADYVTKWSGDITDNFRSKEKVFISMYL